MPAFKRIVLKITGEALSGNQRYGFDSESLSRFCSQVKEIRDTGVQVSIVTGGGNIIRGLEASAGGFDRVTADHMGMLGTLINCLALQTSFEKAGVPVKIFSSRGIDEVAEHFNHKKAIRYLEKGKVVLFAGGTGNPFFSTDTAAALRAAQINADVILKATKVDGVYESDPKKNPGAKKFERITFTEVLNLGLKVMDAAAFAMCRENGIPIIVFNFAIEGNLLKVVNGEPVGTIVKEDING